MRSKLNAITLDKNDFLVSFDVISLYTNTAGTGNQGNWDDITRHIYKKLTAMLAKNDYPIRLIENLIQRKKK